jgi:hypothetical protein
MFRYFVTGVAFPGRTSSGPVLAQHGLPDTGIAELESFVRELFEALWRVDLVAMALPAGA